MKLLEILRFEIDYELRRPSTWFFLAAFLGLAYFITAGMLAGEAERAGDLYANGPAALAMGNILVSMVGLLVSAALFSDAALRDVETRMQPLFAASPITRTDYHGGRFIGALIVNALLISVVPFALMLFMRAPFLKPEFIGPFSAAAYFRPFFFFLLPNLFTIGAVLFAVAVVTRRSLPVFAVAAFLFLGALAIEEVIGEQFGALAAILEPFGFSAMSELWEFWTPFERNTRQIRFEGLLLWNRLLWFGVASLTLFSLRGFGVPGLRGGRASKPHDDPVTPQPRNPVTLALPAPSFGPATKIRQTLAIAGQSLRELVLSRDFLLISAGLIILVVFLGNAMIGDHFGVPFWPLTQFVAPFLGSFLPEMMIALLTAFYAGELVWRERDAGLNEISDANPVPDWALFLGKFGALALMLVALQAVLMAGGLLLQAIDGYFRFELGLYLKIVLGLQLADYLLLAALALLVHVLVDNKYFGHLLVVLCHLVRILAPRLGIDHNLIVYGDDPGWVYSDISGFGPFLRPVLWFKLYWAGWAVLFAVVASLFWIRGRDRGSGRRLRLAAQRFTRTSAVIAAAGVLLIVSVGSFIYYNVNVLAGYRTRDEAANLKADYERRYSKYESAPSPTVTGTKLHVEIYPDAREVAVRGTYTLRNATRQPIETVHLFMNPEVENGPVAFSIPARIAIDDRELGHRGYTLASALAPGKSLEMRFDVRFKPRGFPNSDINTSVVRNGTYFDHTGGRRPNHRRWLPLVGYQSNRELENAAVRRKLGLPARPLAPDVDDLSVLQDSAGRESIDFEAVIGTSADQIAVAPGTLQRTWSEQGRRYFHYKTGRTIKNAFAIFSADYKLHEETWKGVPIQIFHHPTHTFNVTRFARAAKASLDYYTANFGPYPYREIRIAAFPKYASLAFAYPGTISYAETMGWMTRIDETRHVDEPTALVAHEVAHQWWGHQVVPATAAGAGMVSEVLAQYSALMVLEKTYGPEMVRRFLRTMRIEYLNRRGRPEHAEVPLLLVTEHANLVYRKGPLAMYALREYIGEEPLNAALRRLLEKHRSGQPPYATSLDLYRELKAATPPSLHYLLEDFLEQITLWNLRATAVTARPSGPGTWQVTLDVQANKLRADGTGEETEVPMNDVVEIGVFDAGDEPLYLKKHRVRSGVSRITVSVAGKPARAGIDPHLHLIDRNWQDNMRPAR